MTKANLRRKTALLRVLESRLDKREDALHDLHERSQEKARVCAFLVVVVFFCKHDCCAWEVAIKGKASLGGVFCCTHPAWGESQEKEESFVFFGGVFCEIAVKGQQTPSSSLNSFTATFHERMPRAFVLLYGIRRR